MCDHAAKSEREGRALPECTLDVHLTALRLHGSACDREPEADAAGFAGVCRLEELGLALRVHSRARVRDTERHAVVLPGNGIDANPARVRVLHGVLHEVAERIDEEVRI